MPPRPPRPSESVDSLLMMATSAPFAVKDADAQKLVDKVLADRKAMLQSELAGTEALEKVAQAARAGDEAATAAARQEVMSIREKANRDIPFREDLQALAARLQALSPAPAMPMKEHKEMKGATEEAPKAK